MDVERGQEGGEPRDLPPPARASSKHAPLEQLPYPLASAEYAVQVRGLDYRATARELVSFFDNVELPATPLVSYDSSCHAFIPLRSEADVDAALRKDKQYLGRR